MLLAAMTALFLFAGFALGGEGGAMIALLVCLGMNVYAYWNSADSVLRMHNARLVDRTSAPEFVGMIEDLSRRAELPVPKVYIIETDQPNAFATGRSPEHSAVAATSGLLRRLSREEVAGVMAHELAHIKNRDTLIMTITATIAGAISFLASWGWLFGGRDSRPNPIIMIALMILAPLAAAIIQFAVSRTREYGADREGAVICGNPRWLASALQSIEQFARGQTMMSAEKHPATAHLFIINPLRMGGIDNLFRTHPPTEDRVSRLLEMAPTARSRGRSVLPQAGG